MKVGRLIEKLAKLNPNHEVLVFGYEGGYCIVSDVEENKFIRDVHDKSDWWYGPHELEEDYKEHKGKRFKGVVIK